MRDVVELAPRDGAGREQLLEAVELGAGVGEPRRGRADLRLEPPPLLGALAGAQRRERRARLIELALPGLQLRLELVLPELRDQLALGDALPLAHRQAGQDAGHLERELDAPRGFDRSGQQPLARLAAGGHHRRLDRTNDLGRSARAAARIRPRATRPGVTVPAPAGVP